MYSRNDSMPYVAVNILAVIVAMKNSRNVVKTRVVVTDMRLAYTNKFYNSSPGKCGYRIKLILHML